MDELVSSLGYSPRVVFIPGNHDPELLFQQAGDTGDYINAHFKFIEVAPGLFITGFGGSVPGYLVNDKKEPAFLGYPFNTEADVEKALTSFTSQFDESMKNNQFIFLSHCGPMKSPTSILWSFGQEIDTGSSTLDKMLTDHSENMVVYMHGHSHTGAGVFGRCIIRLADQGCKPRIASI